MEINGVITFPHIILGNKLQGIEHTYNCVNGGIKPIADFNLKTNKFFGGNVLRMGFVKEYGFYACPHFELSKLILGFYIHDPVTLTELGRRIIKEMYPGKEIVWEKVSPTVHRDMTPEELQRKRELIEQAKERGVQESQISNSTIEELDGVLRAIDSGHAQKVQFVGEPVPTADRTLPVTIEHKGRGRVASKVSK